MSKHLLTALVLSCTAFSPAFSAELENAAVAADRTCKTIVMDRLHTITVMGSGKIFARPDMAESDIGVSVQAPTAAAALAQNSAAMNNLMDTLKANGIEDRDITTSQFTVEPQYSEGTSSAKPPKVSGYRVVNRVAVKVRNLKTLGPLLDAVVKSGANTIDQLMFSASDPEPLLDKARALAVADAHRKAKLYAQAAGVNLGPVQEIVDEAAGAPPMPLYGGAMRYTAAAATPVAAGEMQFKASVQVVYGLQ